MWLLRLLLTILVAIPVALLLLFAGVLAWAGHAGWIAVLGAGAAWVLFVHGMQVVTSD